MKSRGIDVYKSLIKSDLENIEELYWKIFNYNKNFNGSLQNHYLWNWYNCKTMA